MSASTDEGADQDFVIAWPDPEFELVLRKPVEHADETITSVMLREPTGGEWEEIFAQPEKLRRRYAVSRVGGIPMAVAAKIGIGDLVRGEAYLNSFFEVGLVIATK